MAHKSQFRTRSNVTYSERLRNFGHCNTYSIANGDVAYEYEMTDSMKLQDPSSDWSTHYSVRSFKSREDKKDKYRAESDPPGLNIAHRSRRRRALRAQLDSAFKPYPRGITRADLPNFGRLNEVSGLDRNARKRRHASPEENMRMSSKKHCTTIGSDADDDDDDDNVDDGAVPNFLQRALRGGRAVRIHQISALKRMVESVVDPLVSWTMGVAQEQGEDSLEQYQPGSWRQHVMTAGKGRKEPKKKEGDEAELLKDVDGDADLEDNGDDEED